MADDRADWIKRLFVEAADLPPDRHAEFLRERCGSDTAARFELESLLETEKAAPSSFMEAPAFAGPEPGADHAIHVPPERIGRYRVVRVLGEGGMSVVYLAEQEQPRRQVAVKVIRPGAMSTSMYRRFQLEAEVLGTLKHEGIAQIYEADTESTPTGPFPFFAMEFVEGESLDRYAREHELDARAKLALLARVCDAVHHAHQKGVLHRDLKPANILVTRRRPLLDTDSAAAGSNGDQPKILDFGVARAINSDLQLTTLATKPGQIIGTIPYMSPEQVQANSDELDVRSDVYALGVIGYELLAEQLPYDLADRSIAEAARIIRDSDPPSIATILPQLRGDVATILSKAMEKNKGRRYQSAAELAADIRRFLDDEPILARPPTALYQMKKFAKRHKGLVTGAAIGVLALVLGLVISVQQAVVATAARDRARLEESRSRRLAYRANITAASAALAAHDIALARRNLEEIEPPFRQWEWQHLHSRLNHSLLDINVTDRGPIARPFLATQNGGLGVFAPVGSKVLAWDAHNGAALPDLEIAAASFARSRSGSSEAMLSDNRLTIRNVATGEASSIDLTDLGAQDLSDPDHILVSDGGQYVAIAELHCVWRIDLEARQVASLDVDRRQTGVMRMALEEGGRIAIAAALRGQPVIWNADTQEKTPLLNVPDFVRSVSFSADGRRLLCGMQNATVMIWDTASRKPIATGRGHRHAVTDAVWDPSGGRIASVSLDRTIRLWDAESLAPLGVLHGHDRAIWYATFSADGRRLVTTGEDRTVRLWDTGQSQPPGVLVRHDSIVFPVVFNPDGSIIASAGWDHRIRFTDAESHEVFAALDVEADVVTALCFSPDGSRLAAITNRGCFAWDLYAGVALPLLTDSKIDAQTRFAARALSFDPDGVHVTLPISAGDGAWYVWNTTTGVVTLQQEHNLAQHHSRLVGPGGRFYARYKTSDAVPRDPRSAQSDSGTRLTVLELATGVQQDVPELSGAFAFGTSREGHVHLAARLDRDQTAVCVWDLTANKQVGLLEGHAENVYAIAYSPDGTRIATAARDSLRLWDARTLDEIVQLQGHTSFVWSVAFSPDGTQLVSGSGDRTVRVWDTKSYKERFELRNQRAQTLARIEPDVRRIARQARGLETTLDQYLEESALDERARRVARQLWLGESLMER